MATTSALRKSYPELVPDPSRPRCDYSKAVPVVFLAAGAYPSGRIVLKVHPATRQLWRALAAVMLFYGYAFEETAGGTLSCRKITGGSGTSLHAHGIAGDWNPSRNRYRHQTGPIQWGRHTDMPREMVRAIEAVQMTNGLFVFEWGGRWTNIKDPMHYEVDQLQSRLAPVNLATLPKGAWAAYLAFEKGAPVPDPEEPMLSQMAGTKSQAVADHQRDLIELGYDLGDFTPYGPGYPPGADGFWGSTTSEVDEAFEADRGLPVRGDGNALTVDNARAAANPPGGSTVDQVARDAAASAASQAQAARGVADKANAGATRANQTLDKIRSE